MNKKERKLRKIIREEARKVLSETSAYELGVFNYEFGDIDFVYYDGDEGNASYVFDDTVMMHVDTKHRGECEMHFTPEEFEHFKKHIRRVDPSKR